MTLLPRMNEFETLVGIVVKRRNFFGCIDIVAIFTPDRHSIKTLDL